MPNDANEHIDRAFSAAVAAWQSNDLIYAETKLRALNAQAPAREDVARLLSNMLRNQGRLNEAGLVALALCKANHFEAGVCLRSADFARQCNSHAIASQICDRALAQADVTADLLVLAAHVAREAGDFDLARARYLQALDAGVDLERQHVLGALANTRRYTDPADPDIIRFERHCADARYTPRSRASAGFALAKAQNDLGDYENAARTLREANAMVHVTWPWGAADWQRFVDARRQEQVASAPEIAAAPFVPVFIVGLPRTGTTLTATLLSKASTARDRGELRTLRFIADQLSAGGHSRNPAALAEAAGLYRKLAVQDDSPATWYLDQDPLNFRYLDIAAAMFPQARVIHLRRDRRDAALSLWSQDFGHPDMAFAYDFADMAAYMQGHDDLMQHWKQSLRIPIHDLDYETLVADTEAALADLRNFIGAPARESDHSENDAPVQSASVWQARQPVYKTSMGRWRHYVPYVPELERFEPRD